MITSSLLILLSVLHYVCIHVQSAAPLLCTSQLYLNKISDTFVCSR